MSARHPIEAHLDSMSKRDRRIAEDMSEAGFNDEALYAALPTPYADALLKKDWKKRKKATPPSTAQAGELK